MGPRNSTRNSEAAIGSFPLGGSCIDCDFSYPPTAESQRQRSFCWAMRHLPFCCWGYTTSWLNSWVPTQRE